MTVKSDLLLRLVLLSWIRPVVCKLWAASSGGGDNCFVGRGGYTEKFIQQNVIDFNSHYVTTFVKF
jgi:hypothetical protein